MSAQGRFAELVAADQSDRHSGMQFGTGERDLVRRAEVRRILDSATDLSRDELAAAALIMQHSDRVTDIDLAHQLAAQSFADGHTQAGWLVAATADRAAMYRGQPQPYGTQMVPTVEGWRMWDVDPTTTDDDRDRLGVLPLAALIAGVEVATAGIPFPPADAGLPTWLLEAQHRQDGSPPPDRPTGEE